MAAVPSYSDKSIQKLPGPTKFSTKPKKGMQVIGYKILEGTWTLVRIIRKMSAGKYELMHADVPLTRLDIVWTDYLENAYLKEENYSTAYNAPIGSWFTVAPF